MSGVDTWPAELHARSGERTSPDGKPIRSNADWRKLAEKALGERDAMQAELVEARESLAALAALAEPMTAEEARGYAPQWGETCSSGGIAAYNIGTCGEDLAELRAYALGDCMATAKAGLCCGLAEPCADDMRQLERLAAYCTAELER